MSRPPIVFTAASAALEAHCSERTIRRAIKRGELIADTHNPKGYRITPANLSAWQKTRGTFDRRTSSPTIEAKHWRALRDEVAALRRDVKMIGEVVTMLCACMQSGQSGHIKLSGSKPCIEPSVTPQSRHAC